MNLADNPNIENILVINFISPIRSTEVEGKKMYNLEARKWKIPVLQHNARTTKKQFEVVTITASALIK